MCDHKYINKKQGDDSPKALGITALITDGNGVQSNILLDYLPVENSTDALTVPLLQENLMKFDLWDAFKESKIAFSCDGGMISTIEKLFLNNNLEPLINCCQVCSIHRFCGIHRFFFNLSVFLNLFQGT